MDIAFCYQVCPFVIYLWCRHAHKTDVFMMFLWYTKKILKVNKKRLMIMPIKRLEKK